MDGTAAALAAKPEAKLVAGEAGYVLEDVPHVSDYLPDLPVSACPGVSACVPRGSIWASITRRCARSLVIGCGINGAMCENVESDNDSGGS
jgi:hypothetical protein